MSPNHQPLILRMRPQLKHMNKFMQRIYGATFPGRRMILLLTTTGRKSGKKRVTPLQYELIDGVHWVASGWGKGSDWVKNIEHDPRVIVQVGGQTYPARVETVTTPAEVANFLEIRLKRHPFMMRAMLHAQGLPLKHGRKELERFCKDIIAVKLLPL